MAAKCAELGAEKEIGPVITHNGVPIPSWTDTAKEYLVVARFPHLQKRKSFESGLDCLTLRERLQLDGRADQVEADIRQEQAVVKEVAASLHSKVSLLPGGNLAHIAADAVVNASNIWLTTGKGINGTLHAAAGRHLLDECIELGGCDVGQAKLTLGYDLPAKHVIHCVGPEGKNEDREMLLRQCYTSCLELCKQHSLHTVAFCCISTGQYGYPSVEAADVALSTTREWLLTDNNHTLVDRIVFTTRRVKDEEAYSKLMMRYFPVQ